MPVTINGTTGIAGPDGSASTPAVQGTDSNTGLFYPAADTVALSTGGTERMRITSAGNVGIGTSSPSTSLHVVGSSSAITATVSSTSTTINGAPSLKVINTGSSTTNQLAEIQFRYEDGTYNANGAIAALRESGTARGQSFIFAPSDSLGNAAERMRILSGGKVLINATTDRDKWDNSTIGSNLLQVERSASGGNSSISVTNNPGTFADAFSLLYLGRSRGTANNDYTAVASGDGLGVVSFQGADGTEFVEAASIRGYVDGTPGANDMPGRLMFFTTPDGSATPTERMRITSGGDLLVGTTTNTYSSKIVSNSGITDFGTQYNVSTSGGEYSFVQRAASKAFLFYVDGANVVASLSNTGVWTNASDARYKENVQPIQYGLDAVMQLRPREYNFIGQKKKQVGFIAQEVLDVVPEVVDSVFNSVTGEDRYTLSYGNMVSLCVKAIQELKAIVDAQAVRIAALESHQAS